MKIIDNNGRLFGKVSVIDVLAVLVVLVLAAALYVKSHQQITGTSVDSQAITYQALAQGLPGYLEENIHVGDMVYDLNYESGGRPLGEITDIQVLPGSQLTAFTDGTYGLAQVEEGVNLLLTIRGEGLVTDWGYSLNRVYDLGVNSARTYCSKYAQFDVTVTHIF